MEYVERNLIDDTRLFGSSITRNLMTRVLTFYHMKLAQSTALEPERFDLRSILASLCNPLVRKIS